MPADHSLDLPRSDLAQDAQPPDAIRSLARSPHPYHRRKIQAPGDSPSPDQHSTRAWSSGEEQEASGRLPPGRRDLSTSVSESGTEADDEGYTFVKALPAPPIRQHKGLRGLRESATDGASSPLLTPSRLDEEGRKLSKGYFRPRKRDSEASSPSDEEVRAAREKFIKRRRAELLRRASEIALLGAIGALVLYRASAWQELTIWSRVELSSLLAVLAILVILYPLRLLALIRGRSPNEETQENVSIRIPAAFDPAPLLYPSVLPVLVSLSLYPQMERTLLPNIVLAIAALPPQLIPTFGQGNGYSMEHWLISIVPLIVSQHTDIPSSTNASKPYILKVSDDALDPEVISSLFALHQALLPTIHYLTSTSLLPAESQLLSVSLINLLVFSETPQMRILSAIIWIGALALFVLCGHVIRWGVALARIPKWRFRRAGQVIKTRQSFLQILNDSIRAKASDVGIKREENASDSDADDDVLLLEQPKRLAKVNTSPAATNSLGGSLDSQPQLELSQDGGSLGGSLDNLGRDKPPRAQRRSTLPSLGPPDAASKRSGSRQKRSKTSHAQSFLALTPAQAAVRKWLYAGYVYLSMALVIFIPIRLAIMKYCFHDMDPFGWAVGYLLGNLREVRFLIFTWGLDNWIALPPLQDTETMRAIELGRAGLIRQILLGPANSRLAIIGYWLGILAFGMFVVLGLTSIVEVDTRRKVFHGMMVAMLLPTIYIDPAFVALTLALVLSVFLLVDLIRASQLPPLSKPIAYFLTPYVDGRDLRGPVVVSHIFLLIGCAIPLWLSLAGINRTGERPWDGWEVSTRDVSMVAGVVCVGMGDAAASLVGRRFGRHKWPWLGGKSLEGSLAFTAAVTVGLVFGKVWLGFGQWNGVEGNRRDWMTLRVGDVAKAVVCGCGASFMEAVLTGGNDNVIVPLVLWLLVRGAGL